MQACLQMTERERICQIRKPSLDKSFVPTPILLLFCLFSPHKRQPCQGSDLFDLLIQNKYKKFSNAGHKAPLVNGEPLPVNKKLPIGAMRDWENTTQETDLALGNTLFLYTDGLNEAEDAEHRLFGKKRIIEVLQTTSKQPRTLIERMTQAVAEFVGDTEQSDDLTMLCLSLSNQNQISVFY